MKQLSGIDATFLYMETPETPIICNGFKEHRYVEFVTLALKLGRNIIPVIENLSELDLLLDAAEKHNVKPRVGFRAKLDAEGAGRWRYSSGAKAKFGLSISEIIEAFDVLKNNPFVLERMASNQLGILTPQLLAQQLFLLGGVVVRDADQRLVAGRAQGALHAFEQVEHAIFRAFVAADGMRLEVDDGFLDALP